MTRIAIIGAGCAGLGAATALLKYNVDVLLIEASGQLGGRAWTSSEFQGLPIDMGPQFVQDPQVNPWKPIMDSLGIPGIAPEIATVYRMVNGQNWQDDGDPDLAPTEGALNTGYAAASVQLNAAPIAQPVAAQPGAQREAQVLALGSNGYGSIAESAEPWRYIASDSARQVQVQAGANIYVYGGIGNLVRTYANSLAALNAQRLTILTQAEVTGVQSTGDGVVLTARDGRTFAADYCIVTVPVTQIGGLAFTPPLSQTRQTARGLLALGAYKKVAFRPTLMPGAIAANTEYYIYDPGQPDGCWQYFRLPTDPTILICVASGDFAAALDAVAANLVSQRVQALLTLSYPNGNFAPLNAQVVVTNWSNQPFVGGAYSYTQVNVQAQANDATAFRARVEIAKPHGRVHFAGEATWLQGYGTIAGAYLSGQRAADEILTRIGVALT
jgi:monoamine oxidase